MSQVRRRITKGIPARGTGFFRLHRPTRRPETIRYLCQVSVRAKLGRLRQAGIRASTQVLRYLGRYTHRVAISNHRLLTFDGEHVTFRWKDYAHGNKQRKMTLAATEFLRRFTQHILPRHFVRIRQFGFLTNTKRSILLALARQFLSAAPKATETCPPDASHATWRCPHCHGEMQIGPNLSARRLASRCKYLDSS